MGSNERNESKREREREREKEGRGYRFRDEPTNPQLDSEGFDKIYQQCARLAKKKKNSRYF